MSNTINNEKNENNSISHKILTVRTYSQLSRSFEKIKSLVLEYSQALIDFEPYTDAQMSKSGLIDAIIEVQAKVDDYWARAYDSNGNLIVNEEIRILSNDLNVIVNPLAYDLEMYREIGIVDDKMFDEAVLSAFWKEHKINQLKTIESAENEELCHNGGS